MNNPNPFVPQGSLLEQQSKHRRSLKISVFCALAVGVTSLAVMLIQGCKREETENQTPPENAQPTVETNNLPAEETNQPPMEASNPPAPPTAVTPPPVAPPPAPAETEYVVVKGDYLAKIAKANGITVRALEDANPGIQPTKLKIGQKLVIPAPAEAANGAAPSGGEEVYTVKAGDNLTKIAHQYGVTVKALMAENNLSTTKIHVGQKLNIPAKPEAQPAPVNAPPATAPAPEQPAPANPPPAPSNPPAGQ